MNRKNLTAVIAALATASAVDLLAANPAVAVTLVGSTVDNRLVLFDSATPGATTSVAVTGLTGRLLDIDLRPANNLIYGLTDTNNIYTIDPLSGVATFVSSLSAPLTSGVIGLDFNPVVDRLRVIGSDDQNLRVNVDNGAATVDGALNPGAITATGAAYTNADNDPATGTTLFDLGLNSSFISQLFIQAPPNNGTLASVGSLGFGRFAGFGTGFDIVTANGANTAFAALFNTPNTLGASLYNINLSTGAATELGAIGSGFELVTGLTAAPATAAVPEPATMAGLALAGAGLTAARRRLKKSAG